MLLPSGKQLSQVEDLKMFPSMNLAQVKHLSESYTPNAYVSWLPQRATVYSYMIDKRRCLQRNVSHPISSAAQDPIHEIVKSMLEEACIQLDRLGTVAILLPPYSCTASTLEPRNDSGDEIIYRASRV